MNDTRETCLYCRFVFWFDPEEQDEDETGNGTCRRNAPRPLVGRTDVKEAIAVWPVITEHDWCGEFERDDGL